ncbi:MAG: hypothetical protein LH702_01250 [Phormidesmis sp. CAN_BIN44]|nr:hypothetical protein [Phormidesmis sp. CAN_BIN44]
MLKKPGSSFEMLEVDADVEEILHSKLSTTASLLYPFIWLKIDPSSSTSILQLDIRPTQKELSVGAIADCSLTY